MVAGTALQDPALSQDSSQEHVYMMTQKGFKPGPNQDRSFLLSLESNVNKSKSKINSNSNNTLLIALCDGHSVQGHSPQKWRQPAHSHSGSTMAAALNGRSF
jgi:serine/threonine protein phosphatase PrpC